MDLYEQLRRDEGWAKVAYQDSVGVWTVGCGHNLRVPISNRAIAVIRDDDLAVAEEAVDRLGTWVADLDPIRRGVLVNMAFNLGGAGLYGFRLMLAAVQRGEYADAAREMLNSKWARQVHGRAERLARQMRDGGTFV